MMKKVYDIKIRDLEVVLETLNLHSDNNSVLMDIFRLSEYIKRLKNEFKTSAPVSISEQLQEDLEYYEFYKPFYPITKKFWKSGKSISDSEMQGNYRSILMSDEQVMLEAEEFYLSYASAFHSCFLDFKNEANDHLKFIDPSSYTEGETLFIKTTGDAFVFTPNYSNISKFAILIHEIQHVLDFYLNPEFSEQYIIRETIAMFMEMIAIDFIAQKYDISDEGLKRLQFIHSAVKIQASNVSHKMKILEAATQNLGNVKNILSQLYKNGYSKEELEFFFEQDITVDFAYPISYLIAIELYQSYYQDRNRTLRICENIIMNGTVDNIFFLLDKYKISVNASVEKYEKRLYKKK